MKTMSKKYIGMVTDDVDWKCGNIRLDPVSKSIQYRKKDESSGSYKVITIDNNSSSNRIARGSDLNHILKSRNYNRLDCKAVLDEGINDPSLTIKAPTLAFIKFGEDGYPSGEYDRIMNTGVTEERIKEFTGLYEDLLDIQWDSMPFYKKEINGKSEWVENYDTMYKEQVGGNYEYRFYNFRMIRDFVNKNTVVNVLSLGNSVYTDIINLNTVRSSITGDDINDVDSLITVKISIQYSDNNGIVSTMDITFPISGDFKYKFDDVEVEYMDRCIRLFPLSEKVVECIISQCYLYYEKIL